VHACVRSDDQESDSVSWTPALAMFCTSLEVVSALCAAICRCCTLYIPCVSLAFKWSADTSGAVVPAFVGHVFAACRRNVIPACVLIPGVLFSSALHVLICVDWRQVRLPGDFKGLDAIVLPGGESTAMALIGER
jgi:SNO glutamine amidotransferase family